MSKTSSSLICRLLKPAIGVFCVGVLLAGCAPRGETHTVAEVLDDARAEFNEQAKTENVEPVKSTISDLSSTLEALVNGEGSSGVVSANATKAADILAGLVKTAGYPSRPALGEIIMQQRVLSVDATKTDINPARVNLLVARTYSLVASELEGAKFGVQPLSRS